MDYDKIVFGKNCYNCTFVSKSEESADKSELNDLGGIDPKTDDDMQAAREADLVTLPGGSKDEFLSKRFCAHAKIGMFVTVRMCCNYWDHSGTRRPWEKQVPIQKYIDQML